MSFMKTEWSKYSLVDTNVLIYAIDSSEELKHELANELFQSAFSEEPHLAVSTQILSEVYNVCLRLSKQAKDVNVHDAEHFVATLVELNMFPKLMITAATVLGAIKLQREFSVGFYDALIAATMKEHGISTIYTEDSGFEKIEGIKAINPFRKK